MEQSVNFGVPRTDAGRRTETFMVAYLTLPNRNSAAKGSERRIFPRTEMHSSIEGRRLDHSIEARRQPRMVLALRDVSLGGLSAISDAPLNRGEKLAVTFPGNNGSTRSWDATGRVIRCDASSFGYRIAVEFDP